jgi:hypothetical protein
MGRFMSPDPSQLYYADPTNPQSFNLYAYVYNNPLINIDPTGTDACAYDNGDGTATIYNAADGGAVDCPGNGFYIDTTQQVSAVGFNGNGDLSVYGAGGNLYNPDGSSYVAAQTVTVGADDDDSFIPTQTISSPGTQYIISRPAQSFTPDNQMADVCAASAMLHNGIPTALDAIGIIPFEGNAVKATQFAAASASVGMNVFGQSTPTDAAFSGSSLGIAVVDNEHLMTTGAEAVPILGIGVSIAATANDVNEMRNYYNDCMTGKN